MENMGKREWKEESDTFNASADLMKSFSMGIAFSFTIPSMPALSRIEVFPLNRSRKFIQEVAERRLIAERKKSFGERT